MKYDIVLADPPWEYDSGRCLPESALVTQGHEQQYNFLSHDDLKSLNMDKITKDDCLLFMWVTGPKLNKAFEVGEAWGFSYSTIAFVWEKQATLPGYYTLSSVELVLIFKKGKIPTPRGARNIKQFLSEKRNKHSKKPLTIQKRIDEMFPTQKKVELFAREKIDGWDAIGNEIDGKDIREVLC